MKAEFRDLRRLLIAAASAAFILSGCGGGGGGSDATATGPAAPQSQAAPILSVQAAQYLNLDLAHLNDYTPVLPAYYDASVAATDNAPAPGKTDNAMATLGRVLFHDRRMSRNDTVSCASCHKQSTDFGDVTRFSTGFDGGATTAHAPRLANVRYFQPGSMFWNRRAATLEVQSTMPLQHPVEMGWDAANGGIEALIQKMAIQPYYSELFGFAFGDRAITEDRIQRALAQYMRAIVSVNSRWDAGYAQVFDANAADKGIDTPVPGLTAQEDRGRHLFMAQFNKGGLSCSNCHVPPTFALAANSGSNGLDEGETTVFKSPSLKNVGRSSAFMHDGRFATLEEVVDHYATGVKNGPALDARLKGPDGQPRVRTISPDDKAALVAFLKTLSDPVLADDPRFSDPFRQ